MAQNSTTDSYGSGSAVLETLMQQRVFVGNMQRFSVVEIGTRTNAREVIADVMAKGDLTPEEARSGDWMLFEIANDFGMGECGLVEFPRCMTDLVLVFREANTRVWDCDGGLQFMEFGDAYELFHAQADKSSFSASCQRMSAVLWKDMLLKTGIQAIPKSSPTFGGYVEWEHKRGRWTKRWLELREHGLWLSKRQGVSLILRALNLS
jgi:hypothetical protein